MRLALFGHGRMGRAVEEVARERGHEVGPILDEFSNEGGAGITAEALAGVSVAIDFSISSAVLENVRGAAAEGVNMVVGTTGWSEERDAVEGSVREAGTALLAASNFSVGMLLFAQIVRSAARLVNAVDEYDVHLWETHHRHKIDHPSGTARRLADLLLQELDRKTEWTHELQDGTPVDHTQLQVAVTRVGSAPGTHGVAIEGPDDRIELRHEARNRGGFARGAVMAAEWLEGRSGIFTMADVMEDLLGNEQ